MLWFTNVLLTGGLLLSQSQLTYASIPAVHIDTQLAVNSRLANIHAVYRSSSIGPVTFTYGSCSAETEIDAHHTVARRISSEKPHRLVWVIPKDANSEDCLSVWDKYGRLLGRSVPQIFEDVLHPQGNIVKRRSNGTNERIVMTNETGFNIWGPWFDGVALLESKNGKHVDVEAAKGSEVAIVGAGMAGLMTYLVLKQAGLTNLTLIEGSNRLGGRVRTEYLSGGPKDYSYQEMGPMRLPQMTVINNTTYNLSDQAVVFQVIEEMNRLNEGIDADLRIDLIPFIQNSPNGFAYFQGTKLQNGLPPTQADLALNSSLGPPRIEYPDSVSALRQQINAALPGQDFLLNITENFWQAHADFLSTSYILWIYGCFS